ncbi:MAG TPA: DUF2284 domain-containing protein [Thermoplasmatales archaeon]|nr:DUF2284 domain-containing protein [Thermoplasmatales archaeon]
MDDQESGFLIKEINVKDLVFDIRTRIQCVYCERYGKKLTCPPHIPDLHYFFEFFKKYSRAVLILKRYDALTEETRVSSTRELTQKVIDIENEYKRQGFYYAAGFIGGSCKECKICPNSGCVHPDRARIPLEATGVDVIKTCENLGVTLPRPAVGKPFYRVGLVVID